MVFSTVMFRISHGSMSRGFSDSTTMSASFPGSMEPFNILFKGRIGSINRVVYSASMGVSFSRGPMSTPLRVFRFAAHQIPHNGLEGHTELFGVQTGQSLEVACSRNSPHQFGN